MGKYEIIYEALQEAVNNNDISLEFAESVNDLAYNKYVVERSDTIPSIERLENDIRLIEAGLDKVPPKNKRTAAQEKVRVDLVQRLRSKKAELSKLKEFYGGRSTSDIGGPSRASNAFVKTKGTSHDDLKYMTHVRPTNRNGRTQLT